LTLTEILADADTFVFNSITAATKVRWLNQIYGQILEAVKIPKIYEVAVTSGTAAYTVPATAGMKARNIDVLKVKQSATATEDDWKMYEPRLFGSENRQGRYEFTAEDAADGTCVITLYPTPAATFAATGIRARYFRSNTEVFTNTAGTDALATTVLLGESPTIIPVEYHDLFVHGLCMRLAKSSDDGEKANMYNAEFKDLLSLMAVNYSFVDNGEAGYAVTPNVTG